MTKRSKAFRWIQAALAGLAVIAGMVAFLDLSYLTTLARLFLAAGLIPAIFWLGWRALQAFLWKVGRRLAFSYFLIGILPIPMVALLLLVSGYALAGSFLGHVFRDSVSELQQEVEQAARERLAGLRSGRVPESGGDIAFTHYRDGKRVGGDIRGPEDWPVWVEDPYADRELGASFRRTVAPLFTLGESRVTLAACAHGEGSLGVVAFHTGDLESFLAQRSGIWVQSQQRIKGQKKGFVKVQIGGYELPIRTVHRPERRPEAEAFFDARAEGEGLRDRPYLWWGELTGPVIALTDGETRDEYFPFALNATPRTVIRHLFSSSAEIDAAAWGALLGLAFLLFDVYLVALVMALFMIFTLTMAVNRLSRATAAVQKGDFSVRIPVRRKDQVGILQRSFNEMTSNLESLVHTAAQKEILEKELEIARDLQQSLIPHNIPTGDGIEFATLFEPSAAIGGDYFDILRISESRLAIVIADVSGHGLSTGLRMAMLKAALLVLVDQAEEPETILKRLDSIVRSESGARFFVTATLALLDFAHGTLDLTNAGHPPTYLLRGGEVEEILLPGSPLGGIGHEYGRRAIPLEGGDILVWLSDGLIEATDPGGEPFGYERIAAALAGETRSASQVRDRLLAAVASHAAGRPADDDQTLVVMRYKESSAGERPRKR